MVIDANKNRLVQFLIPILMVLGSVIGIIFCSAGFNLFSMHAMRESLAYISFFPAIMISAILGGLYSGLIATFLSSLCICFWYLLGPSLVNDMVDVVVLVIFVINGAMMSVAGEIVKRTRQQMREALKKANYLGKALDGTQSYIYIKDRQHRYVYANKAMLNLLHCSLKDLVGKEDRCFFSSSSSEVINQIHEGDNRIFNRIDGIVDEIITYPLNGETRVFSEVKTPIDDQGAIWGLCGISNDISEKKNREDALRESEERFHSMFDSAAIGMAIVGLDGHFIQVNPALCKIIGYSQDELQGKTFQEITHPEDLDIDLLLMKRLLSGELDHYQLEKRYFHHDGYIIWISLTGSVVHDPQHRIKYFIAQIVDITERKLLLQKLEEQAHYDALTNLYNRHFFFEQGEIELSRSLRQHIPLSVLMIDVDFFKKINDTYGHKTGDLMLQHISQQLRDACRKIDIIGRIGGEEFVVMLSNTSIKRALKLAERIRVRIANAGLSLNSGEIISCTLSIGVASLDEGHPDINHLLSRADTALYQAKKSGRNRVCLADV